MNASDFLGLGVPIAFIAIGIFGESFYFAKGIAIAAPSSKKAPTWLGRIFFVGGGLLGLVVRIAHMLSRSN
jgi:hypothetical protein